jgi:hypothetical protein
MFVSLDGCGNKHATSPQCHSGVPGTALFRPIRWRLATRACLTCGDAPIFPQPYKVGARFRLIVVFVVLPAKQLDIRSMSE